MPARLIALAFLPLATCVCAQDYEYRIGQVGSAVVIDQPAPEYPGDRVRRGQEGWVKMHFVVTADGDAIDPIIIDSVGGAAFESEARLALQDWRFEVTGPADELPDNLVSIRSEIERGRDAATSNFLRRYRSIMTRLVNEETGEARKRVDNANDLGGWNLYESTMLWLMIGRVEGAEGNPAGKLEAYQRALDVSNSKSLSGKARRAALAKIFALQHELGHFAHAASTFELLRNEKPDSKEVIELEPRANTIAAATISEPTLTARATIYNPCDCDTGEPLWYYRPGRRTFSFANLSGNAGRFEARCATRRIGDDIVAGKRWTLPPDWGSCQLFVFGDDGASFDFLEHLDDGGSTDPVNDDVARPHVVD